MAATTIILKNNTVTDIYLADLDITVPGSGQFDASTWQPEYILRSDRQLQDLVDVGDITINDGTTDLSSDQWNGLIRADSTSDPQSHSERHIDGGADAIDGDKLEISYVPANYTRDLSPAEVDQLDQLTSHLKGLDTALAGAVGTGDVVGPASATDSAVALYDTTTGKLIKNSTVTIDGSGNIATSGNVDGRDVSADGTALDTHTGDTANPHSTSLVNIGSGTLAQLNTAVTDATLDDSASPRTPTAHASTHIDGGSDAIDGDKLEISYVPANYTRDTSPTEVDQLDQLTAHLKGLDTALAGAVGTGDVVGPAGATDNAIARYDAATGKLIQDSNVKVLDDSALQLDTTVANPAHAEGKIFYDKDEHTLAVYNDASAVTHQLGQEGLVRVYNNSGSLIADGSVVYVSGTEGVENRPTIALAQADAPATSSVVGFATMDIANNAFGYVTHWGLVNGLNTSGFVVGEELYLSATTPGAFTATRPLSGNDIVRLGEVIRADASAGRVLVHIDNWGSVDDDEFIGGTIGSSWKSGLSVSAQGGGTKLVDYTSGTYYIGATLYSIGSNGTYDFTSDFAALTAGQCQMALVYVDNAQVVKVLLGTAVPDSQPCSPPDAPVNSVSIALVTLKKDLDKVRNKEVSDARVKAGHGAHATFGSDYVTVSSDDTTPGRLEAKIVAGTNVTLATLNPGANEQLEINVGAGGDVSGPGSSTTDAIALYSNTTGKLLKNSTVTVDGSGNITTSGTVDGRDISVDGTALDNHTASTANPHSTSIANIGSGTLAQLNAAVSDATLDTSSASRTPTAHASSHNDGGSDELTAQSLGSGGAPANQIMESNGSGGWTMIATPSGGGAPACTVVSSGTATTTTSTTYVLMNSMTFTPASGTYLITATGMLEGSANNQVVNVSMFINGTVVPACEYTVNMKQSPSGSNFAMQHKVTLNGSQAVEIKWKTDVTTLATAKCWARQMTALEVS